MNIGQAAKACGLTTKTIRYYEEIDLICPSSRSLSGYRQYTESDIAQLQFIQRARSTGFTIDECRQLLALNNDPSRQSHEVKALVLDKAKQVSQQIENLSQMHQCLLELADRCQSDDKPKCAILDSLSTSESAASLKKESEHE